MGSVPNDSAYIDDSHTKTFSVAVVGGGIGGLTLALGLLKYPHIDVQVYEAAPSFGEIGAGVSFGPNAKRAFELISPQLEEALSKHATPNLWKSNANVFTKNIVGMKENEGQVISVQENATGMQSVHRAHFLNELVKLYPAQCAHFGKRLVKIEEKGEGNGMKLHFLDGTTAFADALIGADGIHSKVRLHIIGDTHPAAKPEFAGSVAYRGLVPMDAAVEKLGAEYAQNAMIYCGRGRSLMSYPIDHGEILNMVAIEYDRENWEHEKWIIPADYDDLVKRYEDWGEQAHKFLELLKKPDLSEWALWDYPPAPYYNKRSVVMMGDAAHASTPFQGQGAGQAIEDALVLVTLLGKVEAPKQLPNAFAAYDQIRRPRSQKIVTTSRDSGRLTAMREEGIGDDIKKIGEKMSTRMHWIWNRDLAAQNREAVTLFEESL